MLKTGESSVVLPPSTSFSPALPPTEPLPVIRDPRVAFAEACDILLKNNRSICNRIFSEPRGALVPGYVADVIIPEYVPFTPLDEATFYGHLLFGLSFSRVRTTIARGQVIVEDGRLPHLDEDAIRAHCAERAPTIWARID